MSTSASPSPFEVQQTQIDVMTGYSRIALYVWDILLNVQREKEFIWDKKFKPSTLLYFMVRYPVIAKSIFEVAVNSKTHDCDRWVRFAYTIGLFPPRIAISVCFILRVYVVTRGKTRRYLTLLVSIIALTSLVFKSVELSKTVCFQPAPHIPFIMTFIAISVFDLVTSLIVSWKLVGIMGVRGGLKNLGSNNVSAFLMRSGVLYFFYITIIQLAAVVLNFYPKNPYYSFANDFTTMGASVLIARFLLDLRQALSSPEPHTTYIESGIETSSSKIADIVRFRPNAPQRLSTLVTEFEAYDVVYIGDIDMDEMMSSKATNPDGDDESRTRPIG